MDDGKQDQKPNGDVAPAAPAGTAKPTSRRAPEEVGGPKGLEPTRYGDWERGGRCVDF